MTEENPYNGPRHWKMMPGPKHQDREPCYPGHGHCGLFPTGGDAGLEYHVMVKMTDDEIVVMTLAGELY